MARPALSSRGLVSFDLLEKWLVELLGDVTFADLPTPFAAVATDMETGAGVTLTAGRLAPAVRASCSIPGLVTPAEIGGRLLGDGALTNNLPVALARAMGADYVIAVDVARPNYRRRWGPIGPALAAIQTRIRNSGSGCAPADCLITPDIAGFSYASFGQRDRLIESGFRAAEEQLRLPEGVGQA